MAKECQRNAPIDYAAAAERLLVALASIAQKRQDHPTTAVLLCAHIFDFDTRHRWGHETKRRQVRQIVTLAREQLVRLAKPVQIVADGRGYWLTGDPRVIGWYAGRRRELGMRQLGAAKAAACAVEHVGQKELFKEPPPPVRH